MSKMFKTPERKVMVTWNPFTGCNFKCSYCWARRLAEGKCKSAYTAGFIPESHPDRYGKKFKPGDFVFVCSMGDISFATHFTLEAIHNNIIRQPESKFLFCTTLNFTYLNGAATAWQAVQTDDGIASIIATANGANSTWQTDTFFTNTTMVYGKILGVTFYAKVGTAIADPSQAVRLARIIGGNFSESANFTGFPGAGVFVACTENLTVNPNNGKPWVYTDLQNMQIGISAFSADNDFVDGKYLDCTYVTATVYYQNPITLTANLTPYQNSNVTLSASTQSGNLTLKANGVTLNTTPTGNMSIVDDVTDYIMVDNKVMMYVSRISIEKNGVLQALWTWQYGTLFYDLAGNGHTATPSFLTSTASPNLTANMTTFQPVVQSVSTPNGTALVAANITTSFITPPHMFTELSITAPGADFINSVLNGVGIPRALFWFPFLFGITNLVGLLVAFLTKSIFVECAFMGVLLVLFSLMGGFGFWVCLEYIIGASAIVVFSKQFGF